MKASNKPTVVKQCHAEIGFNHPVATCFFAGLQVVVSGPSEFVLNAAQILTEMGIPSGAVVLLD